MDVQVAILTADQRGLTLLVERFQNHSNNYSFTFVSTMENTQNLFHTRPIDLLICDELMPLDSSGAWLKPSYRLPSIFLTPYGTEKNATVAIQHGATTCVLKDPSGAYLDLLVATIERLIADNQAFTKLAQDITTLETSAKLAKHETERALHLLSVVNAHIYVTRLESDGTFTNDFIAPNVVNLTEYPKHAFEQDWGFWQTLIHPDDLDAVRHQQHQLRHRSASTIEYRLMTASGKQKWVRDEAQIIIADDHTAYIYGIVIDITEQKHTQTELEFHSALLQNLAVGVAIADQASAIFTYVNTAFATTFGYSTGELIGQRASILNASDEDDPELVAQQVVQALQQAGEWQGEFRNVRKDGTKLRTRCIIVEHHHALYGKVWVSVQQDITEERATQDALRQSEAQFQAFMRYFPGAVFIKDAEHRITYCNELYAKLIGQDRNVIVGKTTTDYLSVAVASPFNDENERVLKQGAVLEFHHELENADGVSYWYTVKFPILQENMPSLIGAISLDETIEKSAEEAIRRSEQRYRQMFEMHGLPKLILSPTDGRILDANLAAEEYYGYSIETLKTMTIFDLNRSPVEEVTEKLKKATQSPMLTCHFLHHTVKNGVRHVEVFTGPIDVDGQRCLYSVVTDITEKEQTKDALQRAYADLEQRIAIRTLELEQTKNRIEAIFNHSGDSILLLDASQVILEANATFAEQFQVNRSTSIGRKLSQYIDDAYAPIIENILRQVVEQHETHQIELLAKRSDGTLFDAEMNIAPVNRTDQAVTNVVCIVRNITERKQAQLAVAEERNLLRTVIDAVPDFIFAKDTQHRMLFNNMAHTRSLGFTYPSESVGKTDYEMFPHEMAEQFIADEKQVFETKQPLLNRLERTISVDRQEIWAITTKVPLRNLQGEIIGVVGITHDVSALKAAEAELRRSEANLQSVFGSTTTSFLLIGRDGVIQLFNRRAEETLAQYFGIHAMVGKNLVESVPPHSTERIKARIETVLQGKTLTLEESVIWQGETIYFEFRYFPVRTPDDEIIGINIAYDNITERKIFELQLQSLSQRLQLATVAGKIGVWDWNIIDNSMFWDERMFIIYDINPDHFVNHIDSWRKAVHPDDLVFLESEIQSAINNPNKTYDVEFRVIHKDKSVHAVHSTALVVRRADGTAERMVGVNIEITQEKEAETALLLALDKERELGELKSRFVSMASHEFRTPLASILATTETLSIYRSRMDETQIDARLEKIRHQVLHMKDIMDDVLHLARIQAGKLEIKPNMEDFDSLCREIVEEFDTQFANQSRIVYRCNQAPLWVYMDRRLVRHIVSNLISNALKYSSPNSVQVLVTQEGQVLRLKVIDQGIGIPVQDQKYLFEPFHRATNVGTISGTGLGLSITKQSVEIHQGTIHVESEESKGTTITVVLPLNFKDTK